MLNQRAIKILNKYKNKAKLDDSDVPIKTMKSAITVDEEVETNLKIKLPQDHSVHKTTDENILEELRNVNESYPLITTQINNQTMVIASAHIFFDNEHQTLRYRVIEPKINEYMHGIINRTIEELHENLDLEFGNLKNKSEIQEYLSKKIESIWSKLDLHPSMENSVILKYYVIRQVSGLELIDAIMEDPNIEDISCDGIGMPVFIFHRNPIYGEMSTNISFNSKTELDSFCMRLAQKAKRSISVANPLMDGSLEDGSRIQITYGTDISRRGSNFTIRKFFKNPLSPIDLMKFETVDAITLAYLWYNLEMEKSILIAGSTASGKTTFLNSISLFIRPNDKIVSIEDTSELQLPHSNWIPQVTRAGFGPDKYGEIDMHNLLKSSLRQRPDYLIVGEVRGVEAEVLFQAMATGHPGMSTIHADTVEAVIDRLSTPPIQLPLSVLQNLDIIVFLEKMKKEGRFFRKVKKVVEVEGFDSKNKELKVNDAIVYDPKTNSLSKNESYILSKIAESNAKNHDHVLDEIMRRSNILKWMAENEITRFEEVNKIIKTYYVNPAAVLSMIR